MLLQDNYATTKANKRPNQDLTGKKIKRFFSLPWATEDTHIHMESHGYNLSANPVGVQFRAKRLQIEKQNCYLSRQMNNVNNIAFSSISIAHRLRVKVFCLPSFSLIADNNSIRLLSSSMIIIMIIIVVVIVIIPNIICLKSPSAARGRSQQQMRAAPIDQSNCKRSRCNTLTQPPIHMQCNASQRKSICGVNQLRRIATFTLVLAIVLACNWRINCQMNYMNSFRAEEFPIASFN